MIFPDEYSFVPRTWVLPDDFPDLATREMKDGDAKVTYIAKPDGGSQGKGIFLTDSFERLRKCSEQCRETGDAFVVQRYIAKPMLLDGLKFDLRIYLLVVGVGEDMKLFIFRDGLVRLCTKEYQTPSPETFDQVHMHITNCAVNMNTDSFKNPTSQQDNYVAAWKPCVLIIDRPLQFVLLSACHNKNKPALQTGGGAWRSLLAS